MSPSIPAHIQHLECLARLTKIGDITKLPTSAAVATNCAWAHKKDTLRLYQPTIGWYALHIIRPSYHRLRASYRVLGAQVHYVWWYEWPIWSSAVLSVVDDIEHWEQCATLQGLSYQPPQFDLIVVSSPPSKLHQFILWCF